MENLQALMTDLIVDQAVDLKAVLTPDLTVNFWVAQTVHLMVGLVVDLHA